MLQFINKLFCFYLHRKSFPRTSQWTRSRWMIPVPFSSLFFGKYSGWNWRIQSLWTAFQFKGKFILSVSCINAMLFSKTFIGLARTVKSRYSFQWQYLGADLQPLWVEKDRCYLGCLLCFVKIELVSIHHLYTQTERNRNMQDAYSIYAAPRCLQTEYMEHTAVTLQNCITEQRYFPYLKSIPLLTDETEYHAQYNAVYARLMFACPQQRLWQIRAGL